MKKSFWKTLCTAGTAALITASCSDTLDGESFSAGQSNLICFGVSGDTSTRAAGTPKETLCGVLPMVDPASGDSLYLNATVSDFPSAPSTRAAMHDASYVPENLQVLSMIQKSGETPYCFIDQTYTLSNGRTAYTGKKSYYWPGSEWSLNFYVVDQETANPFILSNDTVYYPYTVATDIHEQEDLLWARTTQVAGDYNQSVPLHFTHACSAVRFKVAQIPDGFTVRTVKLGQVKYSGQYDFTHGTWSYTSATRSFELTSEEDFDTTSDPEITSSTHCFMMLPQTFAADDVNPTVEVGISDGQAMRYYRATLAGTVWEANKVYTYTLSVEQAYDFQLDITENQTVDAHYIIAKVNLPEKASTYLNDDEKWTIEVDSLRNKASLLRDADANEFVKKGYWTDRYLNENKNEIGSARGTQKISGTINDTIKAIYVMIPENTGTASRDINLTVTIRDHVFKNYVITQLPAVDGWEQIDESEEVEFGFNWDRKANYIYPYTYGRLWGKGQQYKDYCQSVIEDNHAGIYASIGEYLDWSIPGYRYYIAIDYSKLNSLKENDYDNNESDGHANTVQLKNIAGTSIGETFEEILKSIKKVETGKENEHAFRLPVSSDKNAPAAPTGTLSNTSAAIGESLQKNRYNLKRTESTEGEVGYTLVISDEDVVWYLPAVSEFTDLPTAIEETIEADKCWSSNIDDNDNTQAKNGAGESKARSATLHVRAKRVP